MSRVEIIGPLGGPNDTHSFHIHAEGCADITRKPQYRGIRPYPWIEETPATIRALVENIFSDFIFANDEQPWEDYEHEVRVFPCVGDLPREAGWVCTHCGKPVELVDSGAWWRHLSMDDQQQCGIRLSDDAYNADEDRYYIPADDDQ